MTDEIDVSKCEHYADGECLINYQLCCGCEISQYAYCKDCEDCYFKQLARKTQEFEELKNNFNIEHAELLNARSEIELYKTWYRAKHGDLKNYLLNLKSSEEQAKQKLEKIRTLISDNDNYFTEEILHIINKGEK